MQTVDVSSPDSVSDASSISQKKYFSAASYIFVLILVVYALARSIALSAVRPLWFDEILTFAIASQTNLHGVWAGASHGFDSQPPLFYFAEWVALKLPLNAVLALRLPSILAFPLLLVSVFVYTRKRNGELIACASALAFLTTSLFYVYSIEARGYSLMNACIAFAMVCYQRLPSVRWTTLLGLSLFLAGSFHYYGVFAIVPFALAEAVYWLQNRSVRWPCWIAFALGALPLILCWPLLRTMKTYYGSQTFGRPVASRLPQNYGSYFAADSIFVIVLILLSIAVVGYSLRAIGKVQKSDHEGKAPLPEIAMLFGFVALPLIVFVGALTTQGLMLDRYALAATIGVIAGVAAAASFLDQRTVLLAALLVVAVVGDREFQFWSHGISPLTHPYSLNSNSQVSDIQSFIERAGHHDLPVVFSHPLIYSQIRYHAPRPFTDRLISLTSQDRELSFEGVDTMFRAMHGLGDFFPVQLEDYDDFMTSRSEFLFYSEFPEWSLVAVSRDAESIRLLEKENGRRLFLVRTRK